MTDRQLQLHCAHVYLPDKGGDAEMFNRIQQAYAEAPGE